MKKLKTLLLFLCPGCTLPARPPSETIFEQDTLDEALAEAAGNRKDPRPVFPVGDTTWRGLCEKIAEKIFVEHAVLAIKDKIDPAIFSYDYSKQAGIYKSGN